MKKKLDIKKITNKTTIIIILTTFFSVLGGTYAYFFFSESDNLTITGEAATVNLELNVEMLLPTKTSTGVMVPQKSTSGDNNSPLSSALKQGCVDANSNVVCQVYKINIKNNGGTATEVVDGEVSFYSDTSLTQDSKTKMPNLSWKLITSVDTENNSNSVLGTNEDNIASSTPVKFTQDIILGTNDEDTYYMIIWFNETNADQIDEGNTFYGKIEFTSSNGTGVTAAF